ncbi:MAG: LamG-like jellyroll fold domain-containing protein, partial [Planctomycetota bacterium]
MQRKIANLIFLALVLALISANTARAVDLSDPDLVAYWPFDEGAGTVANDLSVNGYDGTLVGGASWTIGIYGSALQFNGNDSYVETGQSLLNGLDGFTLAGWVSGSNISSYAGLFGQNDLIEFGFTSENGGQVGVWMSGNGWAFLGADYPFTYPSWHHLALAGDASRVVIYIDGQEAASDEGGMVSGSSGFPFNIGAYVFNENADALLGEIDDVRVFSRALNQEEIQSLMPGSGGYPYALRPLPEDGAIHEDTWVNLNWHEGDFAVSHDVYLGDNFEDVNNGTGETFRGNQAVTFYAAGFPGFAYPDGLVPGTTYYWRVDEVNDAEPNSPWKGDVWSFIIPPRNAYNPIPADGGAFTDPETDLSWSSGLGAKMHTVYFGDNFDDVNNATAGMPLGTTTYDPGTLELNKTYYWRVDESDPPNTHKGDVWSFTTTMPGLGTVIVERWDNIEGDNLNTLKSYSKYPNNPDVTEVLTEFSSNLDLDSYGGRIYGWLYAPATGDYTLWLCADNQGELWLSTDDDPGNIKLIANESDWSPPNTWGRGEQQSDPIPLQAGNKYYIEAIWKEGSGGDQCQVAWQGPGIPAITIIPGANLSPYEPVQANGPNPGNGASDINQKSTLNWKPGIEAASHEVYFGTEADAVKNADMASPEYKGTRNLGDESYDPGQLAWDTTYYWRVDEVNVANPDSPWVGNVWSFTTANFLIVDDMESYNDINEGEPGSNRIYLAWVDGYDNPTTNGSTVGHLLGPPFAEQTIVHSGFQSMPFSYDNG